MFEEAPGAQTAKRSSDPPKPGKNHNAPSRQPAKRVKKQEAVELAEEDEAQEPKVTDSVEVEATAEYKDEQQHELQIRHQVRHEVALPADYNYIPISKHKSTNPARTYPFTLDPFQAMSIAAIERGESVLVSAHTSAGKTVVAEYAIAQSLRNKQRVIYTSPIKALSNQKYRELLEEFKDVGLMTGDVTINPDASCLVMTTEILRSMLYRGSEVMREVSWVVFDEIHYMRDKERGVVWEETIILLPDSVRYVFLSATIPNAMEFAEWICQIHDQPCHVVYTNYRPTPLQHYLFPIGDSGIHLVLDEKGNFREESFSKAMSILKQEKPTKKDTKSTKDVPDIYKIIKMIMIRNYNPVIVFSFAKRQCEDYALKMAKLDFNNKDEHEMVTKVFQNAIGQLPPADQELQQIQTIFPLLKRGIGVHHSGLLPILKEVIELLFQEGLLKVLFATETFAIGLNMPAKTVVFTDVRKFDGKEMRWVSGGEYIQMSGRAGRRGLDDRGIVIMMINEQMEPAIAKSMIKGSADRLDSAFHLGYNMILNLLRVEGISPEFMLKQCFFQFQNAAKVPQLEARQRDLQKQIDGTDIEDESAVSEYYGLTKKIEEYGRDMALVVAHPGNCLSFMQPGRLVKVDVRLPDREPLEFGWCVVTSINKRQKPRHGNPEWSDHDKYIVEVLGACSPTTPTHLIRKGDPQLVPGVRPPKPDEEPKAEIFPVTLGSIIQIANLRTRLPQELASRKQRAVMAKAIENIQERFPDGIPRLDPVENMHIKDKAFMELVRKTEVLDAKRMEMELASDPRLPELFRAYDAKQRLRSEQVECTRQIEEAQAILQMDELKNRKRVLRKLEFTTQADVVELKGRVACEISSGDELLLTELIFAGVFSKLTPEQTAALLSCFVFDEKVPDAKGVLNPALKDPYRQLQQAARQIAKVSTDCKLPVVANEYVEKFRPELMDVVYQWTRGCTFAQICKMTDVFEGSLIRMFRRLEELLRQMAVAANTIGNDELAQKMDKALELIKRDIVSAASLYL